MSLKYHPDKNQDQKEWASEQFAKVSNAYDILSDPELRRVYDRKGEEGVKEHKKNKQADEAQQEQWNRMFGRGQDDEEDKKYPGMFETSDVFNIDMEHISTFYRR